MIRWYVVQTYSGYENSVIEDLESRKYTMGLEGKLLRLLAPEEVIEEEKLDKRTGKTVIKTKQTKIFPGYIFLEMEVENEIDDNTWFIIRNTPKVTGFLGSSGRGTKPVPIPEVEMNAILRKIDKENTPKTKFQVGDIVKITSGVFENKVGYVSKINEEKKIITVLLRIFGGRLTPNEYSFSEAELASSTEVEQFSRELKENNDDLDVKGNA